MEDSQFSLANKSIGERGREMELRLKESHSYYDRPNRRVTIHYRYGGELVVKVIFNYMVNTEDCIEGSVKNYMGMTAAEEKVFLEDRRVEAWERLLKVPSY